MSEVGLFSSRVQLCWGNGNSSSRLTDGYLVVERVSSGWRTKNVGNCGLQVFEWYILSSSTHTQRWPERRDGNLKSLAGVWNGSAVAYCVSSITHTNGWLGRRTLNPQPLAGAWRGSALGWRDSSSVSRQGWLKGKRNRNSKPLRRTRRGSGLGWCMSNSTQKHGWLERKTQSNKPLAGPQRDLGPRKSILNPTSEISYDETFDVVILSNGPGEVATWVKPVVESLKTRFRGVKLSPRISVVLAPCPHASGAELELVNSYKQVDRCQGPGWFWRLLLLGSTKDGWNWHKRGVCIFLGGDQVYALLLGLRLGYRTIIYAEDAVRWPGLADMYILRSEDLMRQVPTWARSSCKVAGDLFSDAVSNIQHSSELDDSASELQKSPFINSKQEHSFNEEPIAVVGLLPGSKGSKLALGVPYFMAVAAHLHELMKGRVRFLLPLAPTATLDMLAMYANPDSNPFISQLQWASGSLVLGTDIQTDQTSINETRQGKMNLLVTSGGVQIEICQQFPAYEVFKLCTLCLTTVGTNTAELGLLGIPMLVVLPTHALEVFKGATGGVLGMLANAPGWLGKAVSQAVNLAVLKSSRYIAWPNRWVGEEVVPELVGRIEPTEVATIAAHYLKCGDKLKFVQQQLLDIHRLPKKSFSWEKVGDIVSVRGAAETIAAEVARLLAS